MVTGFYKSPLGMIRLTADEEGVTGLCFEDGDRFADRPEGAARAPRVPVLEQAREWLSVYFAGEDPGPEPPLHLAGSPFQREVWEIVRSVPYGELITYGEIAKRIAARRGIPRMAAQAVGGAVGRNPVALFIPCHRVVGVNGNLVGYGGAIHRKAALLSLEGVDLSGFFIPSDGNK